MGMKLKSHIPRRLWKIFVLIKTVVAYERRQYLRTP